MSADPLESPSGSATPTELLPCPFCGGKARLWRHQGESLWSHATVWWSSVGCRNCDFEMQSCDDPDYAKSAAAWNRRAQGAIEAREPAPDVVRRAVNDACEVIDGMLSWGRAVSSRGA